MEKMESLKFNDINLRERVSEQIMKTVRKNINGGKFTVDGIEYILELLLDDCIPHRGKEEDYKGTLFIRYALNGKIFYLNKFYLYNTNEKG